MLKIYHAATVCKKELDGQQILQEGKLLLIIDNFPADPSLKGLQGSKLIFLLPNTKSKIQPMGQEVIRSLKVFYHATPFRKYIAAIDQSKDLSPPTC